MDSFELKERTCLLFDALTHQYVLKICVPYFISRARQVDIGLVRQLNFGSRVIPALYRAIKATDFKEYCQLRGIALDLSSRRRLATLSQMFVNATIDVKPKQPSAYIKIARTIAHGYLKTHRADHVIALNIRATDVANMPYAAGVMRMLEDRDEFSKTYNNDLNHYATIAGVHDMAGVLYVLSESSEKYISKSTVEAERSQKWLQLYYTLCVNAYRLSWDQGAGGIETLNVILARGALGPYRNGEQERQCASKMWYGRDEKLDESKELTDDERRVRTRMVELMNMVHSTIVREILSHQSLREYVIACQRYVSPQSGLPDLSMPSLYKMMADFLSTSMTDLTDFPFYLSSPENRKKGIAAAEIVFDKIFKDNKDFNKQSLEWVANLMNDV